jgi:NitT/TauT family transport system substrate-binding protein
MRRRSMRKAIAVLALASAVTVTACGGGDTSANENIAGAGDGDELVQVDVGVLPLAAVAPVYIGITEGFFEEEGLEVTPQQGQGGAALLPAVASGDMEFAYSNNVSLITAHAAGLPIQIVANGNDESENVENASSTVVAKAGSGIAEPADLAGETIAVNTLNNVGDVTIKASLEKAGVDISGVQFVEMPFPDMLPALERDQVDAVWLVTPFTEAAEAAGHQTVIRPFYDTEPGLSIATYFTSEAYAQENPEVVEAFVRAMNRSLEYTSENPDDIRSAVLEYTQIPPEVAETMNLPEFAPEIDMQDLELTSELMVKYGVIEEMPDLEALVRDSE